MILIIQEEPIRSFQTQDMNLPFYIMTGTITIPTIPTILTITNHISHLHHTYHHFIPLSHYTCMLHLLLIIELC